MNFVSCFHPPKSRNGYRPTRVPQESENLVNKKYEVHQSSGYPLQRLIHEYIQMTKHEKIWNVTCNHKKSLRSTPSNLDFTAIWRLQAFSRDITQILDCPIPISSSWLILLKTLLNIVDFQIKIIISMFFLGVLNIDFFYYGFMYVDVPVQALLTLLHLLYAFLDTPHGTKRDLGMHKTIAVRLEVLGQAHPHT